MIRLVTAAAVSALVFAPKAYASSVANIDAEEVAIIVTVDGQRQEVKIPPNATVEMCNEGCFLSNAAGEMMVLKGNERVVLEAGRIRILEN